MATLNRIFGYIGPKRSGKTHHAIDDVKSPEFSARFPRMIIFDPVDNPEWELTPVRGNPRELAKAMQFGLASSGGFRLRYVPTVVRQKGQYSESPALDWLCDVCYRLGNILLIIDEAHLFCSPWAIPQALLDAVRLGGNKKLSFMYLTQGFSDVHKVLTKNTDEFLFWKNINPSDIEGIKARCGKEVADRVQALGKLEELPSGVVVPGGFLRWTIEKGAES